MTLTTPLSHYFTVNSFKMHFFSVVAAAATLIAGSNALFIPRNIHVADFRLYSAEGCHDGNLGVWTVIDDDFKNGECKSLNDSEDGSVPLSLSLTDINKGCTCKIPSPSSQLFFPQLSNEIL